MSPNLKNCFGKACLNLGFQKSQFYQNCHSVQTPATERDIVRAFHLDIKSSLYVFVINTEN